MATDTKPWKSIKHKKDHKCAPPVTALIMCNKGHKFNVVDLNPEREAMMCPVCGDYLSIGKGIQHEQR
jgi:hypothetical protein